MRAADPPRPPQALSLTALLQGDVIALSLTDSRQLARLALLPRADEALAEVRREWTACLAQAPGAHAGSDVRQASGHAWCAFGSGLAARLLPDPIGGQLRASAGAQLTLQVDPGLAWVPWELAFDGEVFLGDHLAVARQVVFEAGASPDERPSPRHGALKVLVLCGDVGRAAEEPRLDTLVARLRAMEAMAVSAAYVSDVTREELADLLRDNDVVHYVGPLRAEGAGVAWRDGTPLDPCALVAAQTAPRLWVVQGTDPDPSSDAIEGGRAVVAAACKAGVSMLACRGALGDPHAAAFLVAAYRHALRGAPLADAVRAARVELHERSGIGALAHLRPELYGDARTVLFRTERYVSEEDTIRQVTCMSIDLVESTRLLGALGAERYSELLSVYHDRSAEILQAHGGMPDAPQGDDGNMCYFGVPLAREGSAAAALRAGFELIEAVNALGLSVRIGICTGEVVVRDGQPIGTAVHLAARLQGIAAPGTIAVGESTRRLVRDQFRFQPVQFAGPLKGIEHPEPIHRALAPLAAQQPGDAESESLRPPRAPFVGRHAELQTLEQHWNAVRSGGLRVVRIVGDAGIGKSRVVREFRHSLAEAGHDVFECRCSQEHVNSAFRPLISAMHFELRTTPGDRPEVQLERLRELVAGPEAIDDSGLALLADLVGIPSAIRHPVLDASAERRRKLTIDLLVGVARRYGRGGEACMIVEDIHWMDPSTAEYLNQLTRELRAIPLLIVVTARTDAEGGWRPRVPVHEMQLRGLSPAMSRALVLGTCGDQRLPSEVVHQIAARSDGVPLFIEESTRMAVESRSGDRHPSERDAAQVPTTILELLTTRLDRLGGAKQVAQVGGAIGREFPLALLEAVLRDARSPFGAGDLDIRLEALQRSGMLVARHDPDGTRFAFKHALMRDAAYRSLLARDRSRLHHVIASVVAGQFPQLAERNPELLAFHYTEAGIDADALRLWDVAARQAASRSAQLEAIGHVGSALGVLSRAPEGVDRDRQELRLQLFLAARLIATSGYGAERVERAYARAMELARGLGDEAALMRILLGLESYHFMRANFDQAKAYVLESGARTDGNGGRAALHDIQTRWALANIVMHQGEMAEAVDQMDDCLARCDRLEHRPETVQDPRVMCLCYSGWSKWQLGFPDDALDRVTRVVHLAEHMKHAFSLGEAHGFRAAVHQFRGECELALEHADRAIAICEEGGFAVWLAHARIFRGRALCELGRGASGVEEMREGYEQWASTGAVVTTPFYLTLRAEGLALQDRLAEALALLEEALAIIERNGERYHEAEVRRLTGRLLWQRALREGLDRAAEAERWMLQALDVADSRRMRSLSLRAATDLAELWQSQGRSAAAVEILRPAYEAIEGGRTTRDLVRARQRLEALQATALS